MPLYGKERINMNKFFTENARQQAKETRVLLWDRTTLSNKLKEAKKMDFTVSF